MRISRPACFLFRLAGGTADMPIVGTVEVGAHRNNTGKPVLKHGGKRRAIVKTVIGPVHPDIPHVRVVRIGSTQGVGDADQVLYAFRQLLAFRKRCTLAELAYRAGTRAFRQRQQHDLPGGADAPAVQQADNGAGQGNAIFEAQLAHSMLARGEKTDLRPALHRELEIDQSRRQVGQVAGPVEGKTGLAVATELLEFHRLGTADPAPSATPSCAAGRAAPRAEKARARNTEPR